MGVCGWRLVRKRDGCIYDRVVNENELNIFSCYSYFRLVYSYIYIYIYVCVHNNNFIFEPENIVGFLLVTFELTLSRAHSNI